MGRRCCGRAAGARRDGRPAGRDTVQGSAQKHQAGQGESRPDGNRPTQHAAVNTANRAHSMARREQLGKVQSAESDAEFGDGIAQGSYGL